MRKIRGWPTRLVGMLMALLLPFWASAEYRFISGNAVFENNTVIHGSDGSDSDPMFTFKADPDTGWYRTGSGVVGFSSNGSFVGGWNGSGLAADVVDAFSAGPMTLCSGTATSCDISASGETTTVKGSLNVDEAASFDLGVQILGGTAAEDTIVRDGSGLLRLGGDATNGGSLDAGTSSIVKWSSSDIELYEPVLFLDTTSALGTSNGTRRIGWDNLTNFPLSGTTAGGGGSVLHTYLDNSRIEIVAGVSAAYKSGISIGSRNAGDEVSIYVRDSKIAAFEDNVIDVQAPVISDYAGTGSPLSPRFLAESAGDLWAFTVNSDTGSDAVGLSVLSIVSGGTDYIDLRVSNDNFATYLSAVNIIDNGNVKNNYYTQLGEFVDGGGITPAFAVKKFTCTVAQIFGPDYGCNITHNLTQNRIKWIQGSCSDGTYKWMLNSQTTSSLKIWDVIVQSTRITFYTSSTFNGGACTVYAFYEAS